MEPWDQLPGLHQWLRNLRVWARTSSELILWLLTNAGKASLRLLGQGLAGNRKYEKDAWQALAGPGLSKGA